MPEYENHITVKIEAFSNVCRQLNRFTVLFRGEFRNILGVCHKNEHSKYDYFFLLILRLLR